MNENLIHHGRNVKRFRMMLDIKQETLAEQFGLSQQSISRMEDKEKLDDKTLEKIAHIMQIPVKILKDYTNKWITDTIKNSFRQELVAGDVSSHECPFAHIERIVGLYERMLKDVTVTLADCQLTRTGK